MAGIVNWLEVRAGYEAGVTVRKLAAEFGIGSPGTISKRADREGWSKPLRPGDLTGTGKAPLVEKRERAKAEKRRKRKQETVERVSKAVSGAKRAVEDTDPEDEGDGLSERERRYVLHYACTGQGALSARRAGYPVGSAKKRANELMQRPRVLEAIQEQRAERMARLGISADRVVEELARIGLANLADVATWVDGDVKLQASSNLSPDEAAAIAEITKTKDGVRVKMAPKLQALKLLAEHTGVIGRRGEDKGGTVAPSTISAEPMTVEEWESRYGAGVGAPGGAAEGAD